MPYRIFINVLLPAPFSPSKSMDLTGAHIKVNTVVGKHTGKSLGNAAHFQCFRSGSGRKEVCLDLVIAPS